MRIPQLLFLSIITLITSCTSQSREQKIESMQIVDSAQKRTQVLSNTVTPEEARRIIDSIENHSKSTNAEEQGSTENTIIPATDTRFDSKEAEAALDLLAKALKSKNLLTDGHYFITDSYDATDKCYVFRQGIKDTNVVSDFVAWWNVYPKTKKIVNRNTEEEVN